MPRSPAVRRPLVLAAVLASNVAIAIEATIVATAMPRIASELGGVHLYAWVFSAYLLTQTATTIMWGKLADLYGRKPVLLAGLAVFELGSIACGFAGSLPWLIAFRAIQGVGAGAMLPVSITVIGDLYSLEERARIQGWFSTVWGTSSVLGPLAGGLILARASWAWVFWINVPVGLAAAAGFALFLREELGARRERRRLDLAGAALSTVSVTSLMVACTEAGRAGGGDAAVAGFGLFALSASLFAWQERRASDPMLDFSLWSHRPIATANLVTLLSGTVVIGLTAFVPVYVQGVLGRSALVAGLTMTAVVLGWPIGSIVAVRSFARRGLRAALVGGAVLLPAGAAVFPLLGERTSPLVAAAGGLVVGLGMGAVSSSAVVMIQETVGWAERGAATASNIFSRNLGSTLGATVLGGVLNLGLSRHPGAFEQVRTLLDGSAARLASAAVRPVLAAALHLTFCAVFATTVLTLALATLVPAVAAGAAKRTRSDA